MSTNKQIFLHIFSVVVKIQIHSMVKNEKEKVKFPVFGCLVARKFNISISFIYIVQLHKLLLLLNLIQHPRKCCHCERHLTNINGTFYSNQFILAKAQLFTLSFLYIEEEPPSPKSTHWGAYRSVTSCGAVPPSICLQSHTFTHFTHSYLVGRSMVFGHILTVHPCSLMCTNHIEDCTFFWICLTAALASTVNSQLNLKLSFLAQGVNNWI